MFHSFNSLICSILYKVQLYLYWLFGDHRSEIIFWIGLFSFFSHKFLKNLFMNYYSVFFHFNQYPDSVLASGIQMIIKIKKHQRLWKWWKLIRNRFLEPIKNKNKRYSIVPNSKICTRGRSNLENVIKKSFEIFIIFQKKRKKKIPNMEMHLWCIETKIVPWNNIKNVYHFLMNPLPLGCHVLCILETKYL